MTLRKLALFATVLLLGLLQVVRCGIINYFVFDTPPERYAAIFCEEEGWESLQPINRTTTPDRVSIDKCPPPPDSYVKTLRALNIDVSLVKTWHITFAKPWSELTQAHVDGLVVNKFSVFTSNSQMEFVDSTVKDQVDIINGTSLTIDCYRGEGMDNFPKFPKTPLASFRRVQINWCSLPRDSLSSTLFDMNIDVASIKSLELYDLSDKTKLTAAHLQGLNVNRLGFYQLKSYEENFLDMLTSLKYLSVRYSNIPAIPDQVGVEDLRLMIGQSTSVLGNCRELKTLDLFQWNFTVMSRPYQFAQCSRLTNLIFARYYIADVKMYLTGLRKLTKLTITMSLDKEPEIPSNLFDDLTELQELRLQENNFLSLPRDIFKSQKSLETLILYSNRLTMLSLQGVLQPLQSLRKLVLWDNPLVAEIGKANVCQSVYELFGSTQPQLTAITMNRTDDDDCTDFSKTWIPHEFNDSKSFRTERNGLRNSAAKLSTIGNIKQLKDLFQYFLPFILL